MSSTFCHRLRAGQLKSLAARLAAQSRQDISVLQATMDTMREFAAGQKRPVGVSSITICSIIALFFASSRTIHP